MPFSSSRSCRSSRQRACWSLGERRDRLADAGELLGRRQPVLRELRRCRTCTCPCRPATRTMKNSSRLLAEIDRKRSRSSSGWLGLRGLLQHPAVELQPGQLAVDEALGRGEQRVRRRGGSATRRRLAAAAAALARERLVLGIHGGVPLGHIDVFSQAFKTGQRRLRVKLRFRTVLRHRRLPSSSTRRRPRVAPQRSTSVPRILAIARRGQPAWRPLTSRRFSISAARGRVMRRPAPGPRGRAHRPWRARR